MHFRSYDMMRLNIDYFLRTIKRENLALMYLSKKIGANKV